MNYIDRQKERKKNREREAESKKERGRENKNKLRDKERERVWVNEIKKQSTVGVYETKSEQDRDRVKRERVCAWERGIGFIWGRKSEVFHGIKKLRKENKTYYEHRSWVAYFFT